VKFTSGRRNGETYCEAAQRWAFDDTISGIEFLVRLAFLLTCKTTMQIIWIFMFGIPEIFLYSMTFYNITKHTNQTALSGMLSPDVIKKRKQKNLLNITMTFWVWLAQLVTNILYLIVMRVFYGKIRFYHNLLVVLTISLNFNILPLFYVAIADGDFRTSILAKDYLSFIHLFM
jgi:hypothetical protein